MNLKTYNIGAAIDTYYNVVQRPWNKRGLKKEIYRVDVKDNITKYLLEHWRTTSGLGTIKPLFHHLKYSNKLIWNDLKWSLC